MTTMHRFNLRQFWRRIQIVSLCTGVSIGISYSLALAEDSPKLPDRVSERVKKTALPQDKQPNDKADEKRKSERKDEKVDKNGKDETGENDENGKKNREPFPPPMWAEATLNLSDCLAIAREKNPAVQAAMASMRASELGSRSLDNLNTFAARLTPDLPFRQQQSQRGISLAHAEVCKVQSEIIYDVTRLYYTFVYARQQEKPTTEIIEQMEVFYDIADELLKSGAQQDLNQFTLFRMEDAISEIRKARITARNGQERSLAALKEAMGVPQNLSFLPRDAELPIMAGSVTAEQVQVFAVSRRPEMAQAAAGVDAFRLEVCAQNAVQYRQRVQTLASGSDLHSRMVPAPLRNGEYRPGAIPPEMPGILVGKREDRVARAQAHSSKQESVYEKVQNLVSLEAQNGYLNWQAATDRMKLATQRYESSQKMVKLSRDNAQVLRKYDVLIVNEALAAKAQAEYLEAAHQLILALVTLERVTAGGVRPDFPSK
jgi:outer membrane protein TolC